MVPQTPGMHSMPAEQTSQEAPANRVKGREVRQHLQLLAGLIAGACDHANSCSRCPVRHSNSRTDHASQACGTHHQVYQTCNLSLAISVKANPLNRTDTNQTEITSWKISKLSRLMWSTEMSQVWRDIDLKLCPASSRVSSCC